jgi:hypothetical protein
MLQIGEFSGNVEHCGWLAQGPNPTSRHCTSHSKKKQSCEMALADQEIAMKAPSNATTERLTGGSAAVGMQGRRAQVVPQQ